MPQQQRHLPPIGRADRRPGQHWQVQRASCRRATVPRSPFMMCRYIVGKSRHRAHTESQREESGESQFLGSLWRATLSREAWMPIWGLSTESDFASPPPGGEAGEPKRRRWWGRAGDRGKHDSHRPFTNRKAAPGEGTVIRARVGRPIPFRARSAQGPVHFPPTWRVIMGRCHPGQPGQGRGARSF